ncbi:ABC transporter substrate-binding protein [Leucobacter luti]|uniref:Peptide/nickel transport system substrate-binding protein n=1 Tax=Leucobacter luti TaxID=340320 RepID=A0A4Q7TP90_9MICO|nr:ABC transporter substrate-binding protein [Leucobacter luti]MBL3700058.1 ABC transporter substrate-binding protein [Leucobacter luti]RZT62624.1 peptide/nickel transport system substrate-binding protein [Leucobacter luti]
MRAHRHPARSLTLAASAVTLTALVLTGCSAGSPDSGDAAGAEVPFGASTPAASGPLESVTWMLGGEPTTLDADVDATTADDTVLANVCDRLMQVQPDLSLGEGIAESAEWVDDTHVVFTIREGAVFHDGSPVTADDVLWSMQRHAEEGAAESDEYGNVVDMQKTGDNQITVTTSQPDAIFVQAMAGDGGIVWNPRVIEAAGDAFGKPGGASACSGPYEVTSWDAGSQLTITKTDNYWNAERAGLVDEVVFRWADESAIVNSLTTGEAQGAFLENAAGAKAFLDSDAVGVFQGPSTNAWVLETTAKGALTDVRLRQALSLALNREGIAQSAFAGLAEPWKTPVGTGAWGYEQEAFQAAYDALEGAPAEPSADDLAAATALVEEAGAPADPIVVASNGSSAHNVIASALVDAAGKIGLEAEILTVPAVQYGDLYTDEALRNQADLWPDEYYISKNDPIGFYKNGKSDAGVNFVGFSDPEYDTLVAEGYAATDDAERAEIAIELQNTWVENAVWLPVVATPATLVMSSEVTGVPSSAAFIYYPWAADLGSAKG